MGAGLSVITPHTQHERGKVIGVGILYTVNVLYTVHVYMFVDHIFFNCTIDSPFQTFAVGLLIEFID